MKAYHFTFETDDGMDSITMYHQTYHQACRMLSAWLPEHVGADGYCSTDNGGERPICWYRQDGTAI